MPRHATAHRRRAQRKRENALCLLCDGDFAQYLIYIAHVKYFENAARRRHCKAPSLAAMPPPEFFS
jgi:hypothetical protein